MKYRKCEICGLKSQRTDDGRKRVFMARFPLDEIRCKKWVKITGNEDLAYIPIEKLHQLKFICGKHFTEKDYKKKKTQLKKFAVPSIRLSAKPLLDETLLQFPCHMFKEQGASGNQDSSASAVHCTSLKIDEHSLYVNENLPLNNEIMYECDIPSVECTIEVQTSEHQGVSCTNETGRRLKSIVAENKNKQNYRALKVTKKNQRAKETPQLSPRKKKLVRKLAKFKLTLKQLKKKLKLYDNIQSKALKTMILSSSKNQNRRARGKRWTENDKSLAIAMFKKSPKLYRYLRHLIQLPSVRTLQSILSKMPIHPGFNKTVMDHLRRKANELTPKDKVCVILFDEMSLKKRLIYNSANDNVEGYQDLAEHGRTGDLADKALVLLLQGVHKKFKQPLAYYFVTKTISSEKLAVIIKNAVKIVTEVGFKVIATVCDQGPTNVGALNLLKKLTFQPSDSNYFLVDHKKVYIIYDVPHLFKSIRNNFFEGGVVIFDGMKAKWSHLQELQEKNKATLHFKKITGLHVNPTLRAKMKVKLASQILSNDVAGILKLFAETFQNEQENDGTLKRDAILQTGKVIEQFDRLFDVTNGPASNKDVKKGIRVNVSKNSIHHKLWPEFKKKMKTMCFVKSDSQLRLRNVRCVNGYLISISSLEDIWNYVNSMGYNYLNLRQLNQDSLENLFGLIRQHSPTNKNPTCQNFTAALKTIILTNLSTPIRGTNCEADDNQLMLDFHDMVFKNSESVETVDEDHSYIATDDAYDQSLCDDNNDCLVNELHLPDIENNMEENLFETFDKQPVVYVSGYIASVIIKRTKCEKCCDCLRTLTPGNNKMYDYIALKEWWQGTLSLTYPTVRLCQTVDLCVTVFERDVRPFLQNQDIGKYCHLMMLKETNLSWLCEEHNKELSTTILTRLTNLLIRNECRKINLSLNAAEQLNSDKNKVAQLTSSAK